MKYYLLLLFPLIIYPAASSIPSDEASEPFAYIHYLDDFEYSFWLYNDGTTSIVVKSDNTTFQYSGILYRAGYLIEELNNLFVQLSDSGQNEVKIYFSNRIIEGFYSPDQNPLFQQKVKEIATHLIGNMHDVWILDVQVIVLESFPEQYAISAVVQISQDTITPYTAPINLHVLDKATSKCVFSSSTSLTLQTSGEYREVSFDTFSIGEQYRPEDLSFVVLTGNYSIDSDWENGQPINLSCSSLSSNQELLNSPMMIFLLPVLLTFGRYRKKN